jgi:protein-tyrosine-phosphatase
MAAACLRALRPGWTVASAGVRPEASPSAFARSAIGERGWPPPEGGPVAWTRHADAPWDLVWALSVPAAETAARERPDWPLLADPVEDPLPAARGDAAEARETYRRVRDALEARIAAWLAGREEG